MRQIANLNKTQRQELFIGTGRGLKIPDAMAEKDFWVCWVLDYLFHGCPWSEQLVFKGGTSLSKCFGLIKRFSEDIDVVLDWRLLGYSADEPWDDRSRTKQDMFNKEANTRTEVFLRDVFLPRLQADFSAMLTSEFALYIDEADPQTVSFAYPRIFSEFSILPVVRMEIGALAAWTPIQLCKIQSYAAEQYRHLFKQPSTQIATVSAERTFWEKATILHKEAYRTNGRIPPRYSRHYYDLYCIANSSVKNAAVSDLALLERVVRFKDRFYPSGSAHYELAKSGSMRMIPPENCISSLKKDYEQMKSMIFGEKPEFDTIVNIIKQVENEINGIN